VPFESLPGGRPGRPQFAPARAAGLLLGLLVALPAAHALAAGPYRDLPARRWTWDEVRRLPDGAERIDRELFRQGEYDRRWRTVHDLLGVRQVSRRPLPGGAKSLDGIGVPAPAAVGPDTLDVLVVRIAFEENRDPHLTTIDPSGDFVLVPDADPPPIPVDPAPRNKAFFESHLKGLAEYYDYQSGGRLHIRGRVLPEGEDDSYKLSDIADYGPGAGGFWTLEKLEALVRDMMVLADTETQRDGSANLADYGDGTTGTYIIFVHAGSDWQSDVNGDSPNDIPTFFVTLGEPQDLIGTDPEGQPGRLSECSVIPETTTQDGYPGSIAAAFYHEFGHALGLPDVYSTGTGLPSAGIWDLMDSGTNLPVILGTVTGEGDTVTTVATGVLPPSLSAWCKDFLGWVETRELDGSLDEYRLPAVGVPRDQYWLYDQVGDFNPAHPQVYRAGASNRDYFLLENRWVPLGPAQTPFDDLKWERDEDTGVILYLAGQRQGGWSNSGLYDYFLPSGGLLVWHVNGDRVASFLDGNTLNWFGDGLRLVEADGIQDIGVVNAYVLGWFGSYRDPFGGTDLDGNPTGFDTLPVDGFPNSRGYDRSWTGLHLEEIGPLTTMSSSVMSFRGGVSPLLATFPRPLPDLTDAETAPFGGTAGPRRLDTRSLTPVPFDGGRFHALLYADRPAADWSGTVYPSLLFHAWSDGSRRWSHLPGRPEGAIETILGTLTGPPALHVRDDGDYEVVWGTDLGTVAATRLPANTAQPSRSWTTSLGDSLVAGPVPFPRGDSMRWLCAVHPDGLVLLDDQGAILDEGFALSGGVAGQVTRLDLAVAVRRATGDGPAVVLADRGWFLLGQDEAGKLANLGYHDYARIPDRTPRWTGLRESDGGLELHVFDEVGELGSWWIDPGDLVAEAAGLDLEAGLVAAPATADLDGDGRDDLVLATRERILAFKDRGIPVRGFPAVFRDLFPLPDSTGIAGPVVVADADGDGRSDVAFGTDGGHLVVLGPDGRLLRGTPFRWGDRVGGSLVLGGAENRRVLWLASEGGYTGPPLDRNAFGGRLSAYGLPASPPVEERSTEWYGPAGGALRTGPAGTPRDLGPGSAAAVETDRVVLYPNPVTGDGVTFRFYAGGADPADLAVYNLEGELVTSARVTVTPDALNEHFLPLPGIASGLYLARLRFDGPAGTETRTMTLAVEK